MEMNMGKIQRETGRTCWNWQKRKRMFWNIRRSATFSRIMPLDAEQMEKVFDFLESQWY